ncbi:Glyoxalase [Rubrivivax sp. A210]|uniref:VOC family protein n=1 Tax=Rubrivivax sp. A210 TaxID=2772301 RepID=UPI00191A22BD|nr:VOC family protein [Rubrivivax sp. A210]CAD5367178.1 Glyoxalase [Rubrivivax sp. A210]
MLLSLGHVTVRSADFERTERFYGDLLGLRIGPRPAIAVPGRWFYIGDRAVLHVLPRAAGAAAGTGGAIDHFAFEADELPTFQRRLEAAGQAFEGSLLADSHIWQVFLTDPDGARVEISFRMPAH